MTQPEILKKEPLPLVEVKSVLRKVKKRDEELNYRAGKTEEYLNQVVKTTQKEATELKKKINELEVPRLKEEHVTKIVDIVPRTVAELKVILQGYTLTVSNDNLKKIVNAVEETIQPK
ncbi:MAG: hypothetical protein ACLFO2_05040 [Candidatus Woesearchaeota archaeon]